MWRPKCGRFVLSAAMIVGSMHAADREHAMHVDHGLHNEPHQHPPAVSSYSSNYSGTATTLARVMGLEVDFPPDDHS